MTKAEPEFWSYERHRNKIPYLFLVLFVLIGAFYVQELKRATCESAIDQQLLIRDLIDLSVAAQSRSTQPRNPSAEEFLRQFYERIEVPPEVCKGTGIDVPAHFKRPPAGTTTTSTTPTTTLTTQPTSVQRTEPPQRVTVIVQPPDRNERSTSTTTSTTTTSTTRPPLVTIPTIPVNRR